MSHAGGRLLFPITCIVGETWVVEIAGRCNGVETIGVIDLANALIVKSFKDIMQTHEPFVLGPGDFVFAHPEGLDFYFDLRAFQFAPTFFGFRTAHKNGATWNRNHFIADFGIGYRDRERNHIAANGFNEGPRGWLFLNQAWEFRFFFWFIGARQTKGYGSRG